MGARLNRLELARERDSRAGCRTLRYAPNGVLVGLYDGEPAGLDTDGGRWQTVCEAHAHVISHLTLELARDFLLAPEEWCEGCMAGLDACDGAEDFSVLPLA